MIVRPPVFELPKWFVAMGIALMGHLSLVWVLADKNTPHIEPLAMSTVMLEFAQLPQSATKIEPMSIGKPQEISQASVAFLSESQSEPVSKVPNLVVEESPQVAKITVKKQLKPIEKPKVKPKAVVKEIVKREVKKTPHKIVKKTTETSLKKSHLPIEKRVKASVNSEVNANITSYTQSAPPKGEGSKNTASSDNVAENPSRVQNWQSQVLGRLNRYLRYPPFAFQNSIEGTVLTAIQIDRNGNVLNVSIRKSSGASSLDDEAIAVAKRASPLPAPPENVRNLVLPIPIRFNINEFRKAQRR